MCICCRLVGGGKRHARHDYDFVAWYWFAATATGTCAQRDASQTCGRRARERRSDHARARASARRYEHVPEAELLESADVDEAELVAGGAGAGLFVSVVHMRCYRLVG